MIRSVFQVNDMDCGAEEQLVRLRLASVGGIEAISVDLTERVVIIQHRTDPAHLTAALASLKLDAADIAAGSFPGGSPTGQLDLHRVSRIHQ